MTKQIVVATFLDTDVASEYISLHQEGNHSVRHYVDTAIVSIVIARALKKTEEEITMLAAAALTMNLSMLRRQAKLQEKSERLSPEEQEMIYRSFYG